MEFPFYFKRTYMRFLEILLKLQVSIEAAFNKYSHVVFVMYNVIFNKINFMITIRVKTSFKHSTETNHFQSTHFFKVYLELLVFVFIVIISFHTKLLNLKTIC